MKQGQSIRPPAVSGLFYPDNPATLGKAVDSYLQSGISATTPPPRALIAPHAGYRYSGPVAGSAYRSVQSMAGQITSAIILGPSHHVYFEGIARSGADAFATPLGTMPVDREAESMLDALSFVTVLPEAHRKEHGLEVHLPFLQVLFGDISILPLVVGACDGTEVAQVLDTLAPGPETLVVISSDLSHHHPYAEAKAIDSETAQSIMEGRAQDLSSRRACGYLPIQGLLLSSLAKGLTPTCVDLRNSGDTEGDRSQVVGYGAFVFSEA